MHGEWRGVKEDSSVLKHGIYKTAGAPPFANAMLAWLVSKENTYAVKQAYTSWGLVGRSPPPVCKHTARIVNDGDSNRPLLCMVGFTNDSEAVAKACTRLKTEGGLGGRTPPICKHNARMVGFKKTHMLSSNLAQAGGCWGAATPVCKHTARIVNGGGGGGERRLSSKLAHGLRALGSPPLCKHHARMVGFKNNSYAVRQACTSGGLGGAAAPQFSNTALAW